MPHPKRRPVPRGLKQDGLGLWSYGFRPFFLAGSVQAVVTMALWLLVLGHGLEIGGDFGAVWWHGHEMLFGFAPAVLAGFLLTAIPNWTGKLPVSGGPLIRLFSVWLVGRIAMAAADVTGVWLASALDLAFLPLLLAICVREIIAGRKWNDLKILAGITAIMVGNLGFHGTVLAGGDPQLWLSAAVAGYVALVLIIGGRIIPSQTRNWLSRREAGSMPVAYNRFDAGVIGISVLGLALWTLAPEAPATAVLALVAAGLNVARLARWRGLAVRAEWLLLVLHLAYGFVPLGFLAIAAATAGLLQPVSALHVLTVGVIAMMMLAMMARTTRGHTGHALMASRMTILSCLSLFAAALARPLADLTGWPGLMEASGVLWILAFVLFILEHAVMLTLKRKSRGKTKG